MEVQLILIIQSLYFAFSQHLGKVCHYQEDTKFGHCGHRDGEIHRYNNRDLNRVLNIEAVGNITQNCNYTNTCRPLFRVARIRRQSLSSKISCKVADMLQRCCNMECTKYYQELVEPPLDELNDTRLRQFDVIYPLYADTTTTEMFGFYFIPVYNFPNAYYFTLAQTASEKMLSMLYAICSMWKLLVVSLLSCLFSSFVIWITEVSGNPEEFPRPFVQGIFEGFWWSFISMTTVGYGDKAPKSHLGRLFSIFWILLGITITSICVATLITNLSLESDDSNLDGKIVGVLENRLYDSVMTTQHGGKIKFVEFNSTLTGFVDLMKMLKKKEIEGFLTARQTYYYYLREIKKPKYKTYKEQVENILFEEHKKTFVGYKLVGGMLIKNYEDYIYFKHYIHGNWLQIQTCYDADINYKHAQFDQHDDSDNEFFFIFLYISLGLMIAMICFGVLYEKTAWCGENPKVKKNEETDSMIGKICGMAKL